MATRIVQRQHEQWGQQSWHKLHQQVHGRKPRHTQAARVSTARRARSLRPSWCWVTPHWLKSFLSLHFTSCTCHPWAFLLDLHLPPFLLLPVLHRLLPLLCPDAPWPAHRPRQPGHRGKQPAQLREGEPWHLRRHRLPHRLWAQRHGL